MPEVRGNDDATLTARLCVFLALHPGRAQVSAQNG